MNEFHCRVCEDGTLDCENCTDGIAFYPYGEGTYTCPNCNSSKKVKCPYCDGTGKEQ